MRYVEQNPVRAGLVRAAEDYCWSSARAHLEGRDERQLLDLQSWRMICGAEEWRELLRWVPDRADWEDLERCTFGGKPLGAEGFLQEISLRAGRDLVLRGRGRPKKMAELPPGKME